MQYEPVYRSTAMCLLTSFALLGAYGGEVGGWESTTSNTSRPVAITTSEWTLAALISQPLFSRSAIAAETKSSPFNTKIAAASTSSQVASPIQVAAVSTIWSDPERQTVSGIASGDGVSVTASSVAQLARPASGIFYGFRNAIEDWDGLVKRYATDKAVINWVKAESGRVDRWISRKFERSHLIGGWTHDYIDPATGLATRWTADTAEPPDGTTDRTKKYKAAWVAFGRGYNVRQMHAAARLYRLTGNTKYADWAAQQLDFYATNYSKWPLQTKDGRSRLYAQGLDEAVDAFALLDVARLLHDYAGTTRSDHWKNNFFLPMASNLPPSMAPMTNIGLWHHAAIAAIAMRYKNEVLLDQALNGPHGIRAVMAYGVTSDNVWIEGTFKYNYYVTNVLSQLLVKADIEGYGERFKPEREGALRLLLGPFDFRFDNNSLPNPADSTSRYSPTSEIVHWQLYRTVPTYWGRLRASNWRTWESLLDPPPAVPEAAPTVPTPVTRNFPALRYAVLRAGNWQAFIHYGQVNAHHSQHELTTYELHDGRTPIAMDPGTVTYGSPYHKGYFAQGPSNNVPLVDGAGQTLWAPGTLLGFSATENRLTVEQPKYQMDARVVRTYRLVSRGFAEQSTITTLSGESRRLGVVFNTGCDVILDNSIIAASDLPPLPKVTAFSYWRNIQTYAPGRSWRLTLKCGDRSYSYTVSGPPGQRLYIGNAPDTPMPSQRSSVYYEISGPIAEFGAEISSATN